MLTQNSNTISIWGLYQYGKSETPPVDLFSELHLPDQIDRDTCIDTIMLRCGQFELVYPDLDFMKSVIGTWSTAKMPTFSGWLRALLEEYNPVENYDRREEWTDSSEDNGTTQGSVNSTSNSSLSRIDQVSAFDSVTYEDKSKGTGTDTSTDNSTTSGTTHADGTNTHTGRVHGNIGVKSSQSLLLEELEVRKHVIIDMIADEFVSFFCVGVY